MPESGANATEHAPEYSEHTGMIDRADSPPANLDLP